MPTDIDHDRPYLAIGEVAKRTGVNPITLRAWQRRFGLVIPARTPKGHRLYSERQLQQIREILQWLERGVAISKVKPLLQSGVAMPPELGADNHTDGDWQRLEGALLNATLQLQASALQQQLDEACSLYPPLLLGRHLQAWLSKMAQCLAGRVDGSLIDAWLQQQLTQWLALRAGKLLSQKPPQILLARLGQQPFQSEWLLTLALALRGHYPHMVGNIVAPETLLLLSERQPFAAVVIFPAPSHCQKTAEQLIRLAQALPCPLLLGGEFAPLFTGALVASPVGQLPPDGDVTAAIERMREANDD
ncbi:MerR family transcriptional regulator [Shewanella sp. YIC-542]|uniref:MerR family transcriptional regulator n=1 Tax=Shewanella mytili TaxID=3377111 RepID=UPI00398EB170